MSTTVSMPDGITTSAAPRGGRLREYFFSDTTRTVQTLLGLMWCLDGGLQFQSYMYSHGFLGGLRGGAAGQPVWLHSSILWGANIAAGNISVWNTLFALTQCLLGIAILYRPLVKPALAASVAWAMVVWWFGEGFGMIFMGMAQPLTGSPGCVLYALIALIAWPTGRPGGVLGIRGAKIAWSALWLFQAYLWLQPLSADPDATSSMVNSVPSGIGPVDSLQNTLHTGLRGDGVAIALILCALTAVIAVAVTAGWRPRLWLYVSIVLNLVYWVIPQGFGSIFAGGATDPNMGPLFVLLAVAMFPVIASRDHGVPAPAVA